MGIKMKVLFISGRKSAGKNTCCDLIKKNDPRLFPLNQYIKIYSFADTLKELVSDLFNIPLCNFYDEKLKEEKSILLWENMPHWELMPDNSEFWHRFNYNERPKGFMKHREILQYFGTEIMRYMWPNIWAYKTHKKIKEDKPDIVLLSDGRFVNEINIFKNDPSCDTKTIRLKRKENQLCKHASETELDSYNFDYYVPDGLSIDQTYSHLTNALRLFKWV